MFSAKHSQQSHRNLYEGLNMKCETERTHLIRQKEVNFSQKAMHIEPNKPKNYQRRHLKMKTFRPSDMQNELFDKVACLRILQVNPSKAKDDLNLFKQHFQEIIKQPIRQSLPLSSICKLQQHQQKDQQTDIDQQNIMSDIQKQDVAELANSLYDKLNNTKQVQPFSEQGRKEVSHTEQYVKMEFSRQQLLKNKRDNQEIGEQNQTNNLTSSSVQKSKAQRFDLMPLHSMGTEILNMETKNFYFSANNNQNQGEKQERQQGSTSQSQSLMSKTNEHVQSIQSSAQSQTQKVNKKQQDGSNTMHYNSYEKIRPTYHNRSHHAQRLEVNRKIIKNIMYNKMKHSKQPSASSINFFESFHPNDSSSQNTNINNNGKSNANFNQIQNYQQHQDMIRTQTTALSVAHQTKQYNDQVGQTIHNFKSLNQIFQVFPEIEYQQIHEKLEKDQRRMPVSLTQPFKKTEAESHAFQNEFQHGIQVRLMLVFNDLKKLIKEKNQDIFTQRKEIYKKQEIIRKYEQKKQEITQAFEQECNLVENYLLTFYSSNSSQLNSSRKNQHPKQQNTANQMQIQTIKNFAKSQSTDESDFTDLISNSPQAKRTHYEKENLALRVKEAVYQKEQAKNKEISEINEQINLVKQTLTIDSFALEELIKQVDMLKVKKRTFIKMIKTLYQDLAKESRLCGEEGLVGILKAYHEIGETLASDQYPNDIDQHAQIYLQEKFRLQQSIIELKLRPNEQKKVCKGNKDMQLQTGVFVKSQREVLNQIRKALQQEKSNLKIFDRFANKEITDEVVSERATLNACSTQRSSKMFDDTRNKVEDDMNNGVATDHSSSSEQLQSTQRIKLIEEIKRQNEIEKANEQIKWQLQTLQENEFNRLSQIYKNSIFDRNIMQKAEMLFKRLFGVSVGFKLFNKFKTESGEQAASKNMHEGDVQKLHKQLHSVSSSSTSYMQHQQKENESGLHLRQCSQIQDPIIVQGGHFKSPSCGAFSELNPFQQQYSQFYQKVAKLQLLKQI